MTNLLKDFFYCTEQRLIKISDQSPIIRGNLNNKRLDNNFITTINSIPLDYSHYPFLYVNEQIDFPEKKEINTIPLDDFEELLFIFVKVLEIKIKPSFNDRSSFLFLFHLFFIQDYKKDSLSLSIKLISEDKERLSSFLFSRILYHHPKPEWFIEKFALKKNSIYYEDKQIDIIGSLEKYKFYIENNYNNIEKNNLSLTDFKEVYSIIKLVFSIITNKKYDLSFLRETNTYDMVKETLGLYKKSKSKFYKNLVEYLDYFTLSYEPEEAIKKYSKPRKRYNSKVKWRTENDLYSYMIYIFNDISSLKELLSHVEDENKKHRLLNIIFYNPIIVRNNKKYNFINKEVLEILPKGYAKNRVRQLLEMKSLKQ